MKKIILGALAAILLLTLTACSQLLSEAAKEPDEPSPPVETPDGGDKPEPEPTEPEPEPEPTGVDEYGFTIWPEGNYLADPKFDTDEYLPDYDADPNFVQYGRSNFYICTTEDSVYTATSDYRGTMLFTDKDTGLTMPLCGKPECTHMDEDCNAYVGNFADGLQVYDGKLWFVGSYPAQSSVPLMRMELDGTNHEKFMILDRNIWHMNEYLIHRGYIYGVETQSSVQAGKAMIEFRVAAQPLDGGESITIMDRFQQCENIGITYCCAVPVGNDIYIEFVWYEPADDGGNEIKSVEIHRWSSKTRKAEQLYSAKGSQWDFELACGYLRPVPDDGIYLVSQKRTYSEDVPPRVIGEKERMGEIVEYTIIRYSFETREFEETASFSAVNGSGPVIMTDRHIIIWAPLYSSESRVMAYDYGGNLVFQSETLPAEYWYMTPLGEDDGAIYFFVDSFEKEDTNEAFFISVSLDSGEITRMSWGDVGIHLLP